MPRFPTRYTHPQNPQTPSFGQNPPKNAHPPHPHKQEKITLPRKKNPHPNFNQQEFVKIDQKLILLKHRGLATSTRRKSLNPKKIPKQEPNPTGRESPNVPLQNIPPPPKPQRRKSENFSALLDYFNSRENPPTSPPPPPSKKSLKTVTNLPEDRHQENSTRKSLEPGNECKKEMNLKLMPPHELSQKKIHQKSPKPSMVNPNPAPHLQNLAKRNPVQKIRTHPPPRLPPQQVIHI